MKTTNDNECITVCNELLRGELSAAETYAQTIKKFEADPAADSLRAICSDHEQAAALLRENVLAMGGQPSTDSGAWGSFVSAAQGVAKAFGESAALKNLREGEERGLKNYTEALANDDVMTECKGMIRRELIPRTQSHIDTLQALAALR
jgi:bacterioferritin (cytochrome b1)